MEKEYYKAKDLAKLITDIERKSKPFKDRSARLLLYGEQIENKSKLETGKPEF